MCYLISTAHNEYYLRSGNTTHPLRAFIYIDLSLSCETSFLGQKSIG